MTTLVVVSGLPASGQTTLARALAAALGMVHLDKDAFLEPFSKQQPSACGP
jgi:predicted kinase